jgi:hypothetical protein
LIATAGVVDNGYQLILAKSILPIG